MRELVGRLAVILLCALLPELPGGDAANVAALLAAASGSALCGCLNPRARGWVALALCAACAVWPPLSRYLALFAYDLALAPGRAWPLAWVAALLLGRGERAWATAVLCATAHLAAVEGRELGEVRRRLLAARDDASEAARRLAERNRELTEHRDLEVRLATLAERNRIAREIHDSVGHALTRCLLQTGALGVLAGDSPAAGPLAEMRNSLSRAMDEVRASVHNLGDDAQDLSAQLSGLAAAFPFCPARVECDAIHPPAPAARCLFAVAREALSNVARHSAATEVVIRVREHPALYQITVLDNGPQRGPIREGMGIQGMRERVDALGGVFRAEWNGGFRVFASIPKETDV